MERLNEYGDQASNVFDAEGRIIFYADHELPWGGQAYVLEGEEA